MGTYGKKEQGKSKQRACSIRKEKVKDMKLQQMKRNAYKEIEWIEEQKEKWNKGEIGADDFEPGAAAYTVERCEHTIWLVDEVASKLTEEEWIRLQAGTLGIKDDEAVMACKDIKEKYAISWNDLRALRISDGMEAFKEVVTSEAQLKAIDRYDKANCKKILLKLNKKTDKDVLEKLDSVPNKQGYIKELIRSDINGR